MLKTDGARFLKKKSLRPFLGQKGSKMPQNEVFGTLMEIESLDFSDFGPERSSRVLGNDLCQLVSSSVCLFVRSFSQDWLIIFF